MAVSLAAAAAAPLSVASVAAALHPEAAERLHGRMIAAGWSPVEIDAVESALLRARLHDTYLAAGWSPEDVEAIIGLYPTV